MFELNGRQGGEGGDVCKVHGQRLHVGRGGEHSRYTFIPPALSLTRGPWGMVCSSGESIIPSDRENIKVYLPRSALSLAPGAMLL